MPNKSAEKPAKRVLFVRVPEEVYDEIAMLADADDRTINSMATHLLRRALAAKKDNQ